jgi:fused signal recognition particle receptor
MFETLRKKIASFTDKVRQTVEQKQEKEPETTTEPATIETEETILKKPGIVETAETEQRVTKTGKKTITEEPEKTEGAEAREAKEPASAEPTEESGKETRGTISFDSEKKRELKARIGIGKKFQSVLTGQVTVSEKELEPLLEELELSLLEADVEQETALEIVSRIRNELAGKKIGRGKGIDSFLQEEIRGVLLGILETPVIDVLEKSQEKKPLVILVLGPNGAGKTTTIAKLTHYFQQNGKKCVWAASDTFRAASIEQLEKHAQKLNVRVVKHAYGADPAAVAFDAIQAAKAHGLDVVLIDSAGRQETNKNLLEELKKLVRVAKPDLKVFVAESYSGQALLQQAREFDQALGLDAFVLTKMDTDPKGGTLLSLVFKLKKPVLFIGTGQEYEDLQLFDANKIVQKIV